MSTLVWGGHSCRSPLTLKGHAFQACRNLSQSASAFSRSLGWRSAFRNTTTISSEKGLNPGTLAPNVIMKSEDRPRRAS